MLEQLTLRLPRRHGPQRPTGPVFVVCACITFATPADMTRAVARVVPFWARWNRVQGARVLSLKLQPFQQRALLLSAWETPADLERFLTGPHHQAVARAFRSRLREEASTHDWMADRFQLRRSWLEGMANLPQADRSVGMLRSCAMHRLFGRFR